MSKKMILIIVGTLLIIAAAAIVAWYFFFFRRSCNPPLPRERFTVGSVTFDVEIASTMAEQACGLSGRTGLAQGEGMLFPFGRPGVQSFWMKDMSFPLDMIWIGGGKVVGFEQNAPAPAPGTSLWRLPIYTSPSSTDSVLEVPAGIVAKDNIKVGDSAQAAG